MVPEIAGEQHWQQMLAVGQGEGKQQKPRSLNPKPLVAPSKRPPQAFWWPISLTSLALMPCYIHTAAMFQI